MINSVLDSLPAFVMSLFPMPSKVEERLDELRRDFNTYGVSEWRTIRNLWNQLSTNIFFQVERWNQDLVLEKALDWSGAIDDFFPRFILP